ncbi:MAG: hypothetical protein QF915_00060, partial [Candidatus Woesearchaeota archaeon]|nr:hypothetical protein [Candidatus Woesearchaeota archaeon]
TSFNSSLQELKVLESAPEPGAKMAKMQFFVTLGPEQRTQIGAPPEADTSRGTPFFVRIENKIANLEFHTLFGKDSYNALCTQKGKNGIIGMSGKLRKAMELDKLLERDLSFELSTNGQMGKIEFLGLDS